MDNEKHYILLILLPGFLALALPLTVFANGYGMMGGAEVYFSLLIVVSWIVWIIVGILAAIWLWKQIQKK